MSAPLSTDLDDAEAVPYFLWDDPMTIAELKAFLRSASRPERFRMLGKILREARDPDVWRFIRPAQLAADWNEIEPYLGRRRGFWKWLLDGWRSDGLLDD